MPVQRDPHEIDLSSLFHSLPEDRRKEIRDFLDRYCEVAYRILERMEREKNAGIDQSQKSS